MAGIYIHIPFCKKKCHYCDFYSNTQIELAEDLIKAEFKEFYLRKDYLRGEKISSIYLGGGSPSMISINNIETLFRGIHDNFSVERNAEITFECNPDDLSIGYLQGLKGLGVNRISIGIQSFDDKVLRYLNRRHDSIQAENAILWSRKCGFEDISIDFIFGIPGFSGSVYERSLLKGISYQVEHISAYHLSIEPGTVFYKFQQNNKLKPMDENDSIFQFDFTIEKLEESGYQHYEVSNYAREGHESQHNLLYWNNGIYLGIGPSAHSYDTESRQWNVSNTKSYIQLINQEKQHFEKEILSEVNKYNEYILTALRTKMGVSEAYIMENFRGSIYSHFKNNLQKLKYEYFIQNPISENYYLNKKGIFILDFIIKQLYYN